MTDQGPGSGRDAPRLLHDWGHRAQAVALIMWKHEIVAALGICKGCRLPVRDLPMFGPRCEIAVDEWELAQHAMRKLIPGTPQQSPTAVGRARVPPERNVRW